MTDSLLFEWCGWAGFILILIPLVLLVRLLVKRSRWSILRMTIVALTGVAIVSLWLHYADSIIAGGPMMMGGKLGLWLSGKCEEWTRSRRISFFINNPYVREIVKEKIVEEEKPVPAKPGKEPKVSQNPRSSQAGIQSRPSIHVVPSDIAGDGFCKIGPSHVSIGGGGNCRSAEGSKNRAVLVSTAAELDSILEKYR